MKGSAPLSQLHKISGCDDAGRKADVVFIHGLGGDAFGTWRYGKDDSTSWPHQLGAELPDIGVWSLGYAASPSKWARFFGSGRDAGYSMSLPDRALQVLDLMVQKGLGERPLLFIGHSLGGLLIKQILRKADDADADRRKKKVAEQTRAVLFLATPHAGATLASLLNTFSAVFGATVSIEDLRAHDAHLRDLYDWYRNHSVGLGVETVTYYELRGIKGVLPIVNPTSAHPGAGADPVGLDEDHISIAKPRKRDELVCGAARDLLGNFVLARRRDTPIPQSQSVRPAQQPPVIVRLEPSTARRIPRELPPAADEYFGRRTELEQLIGRLRSGKNTAVVGPAGLGKTALAAEAVREVVGKTAVTLACSPYPDGVVFLDLYKDRGQAEPAWNNLANALEGAGFMGTSPARDRATEACRARSILVIIEGGEEASANEGRASIPELSSVLSPQNRWLLMTRDSRQANPAESVELKEALQPGDAAGLLDSLTKGRVTGAIRGRVLALLEGHPLALNWAGNLLARDDDDPRHLADDWQAGGLARLSDPKNAGHTLQWLFNRSVRGLDGTAQRLLAAAGLLARAPFPLAAMMAALPDQSEASAREALKSLIHSGLLRRSGEADHWELTHVLGYSFARKETGSDPELRDSLGRWLSAQIAEVLAGGRGREGALLPHALEHGAALLHTDDDQRLWVPLARDLLYDVSDRLEALGRLDLVGLALGAVEDWLKRFPEIKAQQPYWLRERSILINDQGDMLRDQGDLAGALSAFSQSLDVSRRQARADPDPPNAAWLRDLCIRHN